MTIYIHATANTIIKYPFSRSDLSTTYPNVSFPSSPTADDLAPFDVFPVNPSPRPADTRDERAIETDPILTETGWQQIWDVRSATADEIIAWDAANAPAPDWTTFKGGLLISVDVATIMQTARAAGCEPAVSALPVTLEAAQAGNVSDFAACWRLVAAAGQATPEALATLAAAAAACHLPAEFVAALVPAP